MTSVVDKVIGTDISGKKKMARVVAKQQQTLNVQKAEQAKVVQQQEKESEAIKVDEVRRSTAAKKVRSGKAGRRSMLTSGFKGIQDKQDKLG